MIFTRLVPHWHNRVKYFKKLEEEERQARKCSRKLICLLLMHINLSPTETL